MNPVKPMLMLNPKTTHYGSYIQGGTLTLDQAYSAALTAGMPRNWYLAGRLKYIVDHSGSSELSECLYIKALSAANQESWRLGKRKHRFLKQLVKLALLDLANPQVIQEDKERAMILEIHPSNYSRKWKKHYNQIFNWLDGWANHSLSWIRTRAT